MKYSQKLRKKINSFGYEPEELGVEEWKLISTTFYNHIQQYPDDAKNVVLHLLRQEIKKIILLLKGELNEN
nr:MAG TPA: hypothetical protein [Caudoviricetes sp.]